MVLFHDSTNLTRSPASLDEIQLQNMMMPPLCSIDGCRHSLLYFSPVYINDDLNQICTIWTDLSIRPAATDFQYSFCLILLFMVFKNDSLTPLTETISEEACTPTFVNVVNQE